MADDADHAQAHTEAELAAILANRQPPKPGTPDCTVCGDPVSPLRQSMGARLCVDCQERDEWHRRVVEGRR